MMIAVALLAVTAHVAMRTVNAALLVATTMTATAMVDLRLGLATHRLVVPLTKIHMSLARLHAPTMIHTLLTVMVVPTLARDPLRGGNMIMSIVATGRDPILLLGS
jgi:hypothetical protein